MELLYAMLILGGMGLMAALCLAAASRFFAVPPEKRPEQTPEEEPGAARLTALVRCSGGLRAQNKFDYAGISDCNAAMKITGGPKKCEYGCIGLGTCVASCPDNAISLVDDVAVVDHERCSGCHACLASCPKGILVTVPYYADVNVPCSSREKGSIIRKICDIGCLGCRICEKICQHKAIAMKDNLACIDFEKCNGCGDCAEKCPQKLIVDAKLDRGPRESVEDI